MSCFIPSPISPRVTQGSPSHPHGQTPAANPSSAQDNILSFSSISLLFLYFSLHFSFLPFHSTTAKRFKGLRIRRCLEHCFLFQNPQQSPEQSPEPGEPFGDFA